MPPPAVVYPPVSAPPPSPYPTSAPTGSYYPTSAPPGYSPYPSSAPPGYQPTYQVPPPRVRTGPPLGQMFFSGDWVGAVQVVLAGVGAMLGLALLLRLVAIAGLAISPSGSQIIGDVARSVSASVGGDLRSEDFGSSSSTSFRLLGLTILGFALIGGLFVRRFNRGIGVPSPLQIGLQALRVGVVLSGALLVVAILGRMGGTEFGSPPKVDIFSTIFFGLITLTVTLAIAGTLGLPSLFPGRAGHYRALIFGPLRASLILAVIASAASFVILVVVVFNSEFSQYGETWRVIPGLILVAPNIAGYALLFGMGVPVRTSSAFSDSSSSTSILDLTDNDARYWLWPIVVLGLLLVTGVISARRSPIGPNGRPIGYWLGAVLPVVLLIYGMVVPVRVRAGYGFLSFDGSVDLFFAVLLSAVFGLGAGYLGSAIVSRSTTMAVPVAPPAASTVGPVAEPPPPSSPAPPPPPPAAGPSAVGEPPANPPSPSAG